MLSPIVIGYLNGNVDLKERIAEKLGKTNIRTINRYLKENSDTGPLTSVTIVNLIAEETGLTQDQILIQKTAA